LGIQNINKIIISFNVDYKEAVLLQERLRDELVIEGECKDIYIVAGADVSFKKGGNRIFAAVVVMDTNTFEVVDSAHHSMITSFPYIPGLLSFREGPAIIKAFEKLKTTPQAIIFDGQGIAHQRRFGLASHLGLILRIPSVGCAKTRLVGKFGELPQEKGSTTPLTLNSEPSGETSSEIFGEPSSEHELIGYVVRTKNGVKPLFVSPGNMISHQGAVDIVLSSTGKYRLPEPIRAAHNLANKLRVEFR
jgi:deoxyribonuclease V